MPSTLGSLLTEKARKNLATQNEQPTIENATEIYADIIEKDFLQRLANGKAMYRLARHAAPVLRQNCLAQTPFGKHVLYGIVRQVLQQERVPFEAEPLAGLQVLGMLETRMLHFDRVLIVDATDDKLPGNPAQDPLLPDSLRQVLGLPDARRRERATAHTLYRLCAGAP